MSTAAGLPSTCTSAAPDFSRAAAARLTGSVPGGGGRGGGGGTPPADIEIMNGKVDGNNISFEVKRSMGGNDVVIKYEGTLSGDELKLKITRPGQDGSPMTTEAVAKRAAS